MTDASIVIVTYGQWAYTERCLGSLEAALGPKLGTSWEIVVIDNHSPDETPRRLAEWSDRVRVELLPENRNFAGGCNVGAQRAGSEALIFLNSDTEVPAGALDRLVEPLREPDVAAVGCRLLFPTGAVQHAGVAFWRDERFGGAPMPLHVFFGEDPDLAVTAAVYEADTVTGACLAVRRTAFLEAGGFDEGYRNGYEDTDLCFKLRAAGHKVVLRGDVTITHHEGISRDGDRSESAPPERAMATAHDLSIENTNRFLTRWGAHLEQDDALALAVWDGLLRRHAPPRSPDRVADVLLVGQPSGIGPGAEEARALLAALAEAGIPSAAFDLHPNVVARVSGAQAAALEDALRAVPRPRALTLHTTSGRGFEYRDPSHRVSPAPGSLLRLGTADPVLDLGELGGVLVPSASLAAALSAGGLAADRIMLMRSPIERRALAPGGEGLLVVLPVQAAPLAAAILAQLRRIDGAGPVRILPTAFHRDLARDLPGLLPGAELLAPCSDEARFAGLAGSADVVLAADPADHFERRALVAASVGAHPLTLRCDGPAGEILGRRATADRESLGSALRAAVAEPPARAEWQRAIREQCDPAVFARTIQSALDRP